MQFGLLVGCCNRSNDCRLESSYLSAAHTSNKPNSKRQLWLPCVTSANTPPSPPTHTCTRLHRTAPASPLSPLRTGEVVVLFAVSVGERHQLAEQQRVLENPLNRLDQVRLQCGRVLLVGVPSVQELLEGPVRLG